jgi:hypothetical protein
MVRVVIRLLCSSLTFFSWQLTTLQLVTGRVQHMLGRTEQETPSPIALEDLAPVKTVCGQIVQTCKELDELILKLHKPSQNVDRHAGSKLSKLRWMRLKGKIVKLLGEARSSRELLSTSLDTLAVSLG